MTRVVLGALMSHWRRHPVQLATLILGLALATALWSGVQAINAEARASYGRAADTLGQGDLAQLTGPGTLISQDSFVALRRAGWLVTPVLEGQIKLAGQHFRLMGIDPLTAPPLAALGDGPQAGAGFLGPEEVLLAAPSVLAALEAQSGLPELRAAPGIAPGLLIGDIATVQRLLNRPGQISALRVLPFQPLGRAPIDQVVPGLKLTAPQGGSDIARLTDSFHLNLTAFGLLSFAVGLFIVHGAVGLAFEQRRASYRTLRSIGVPLTRLILLSLAELLVIAVLAGLFGIALGYGVAAALLPDVAATLRGLYGADVAGTLKFRPVWAAAGMAMALGGTLVATAGALYQLARLPVLAAAQPRAWSQASQRRLAWQGALALALIAGAAVIAAAGQGLIAGFAALGGVLLGAALALPVILTFALARAARAARAPVAQWFWADTRQQVPGLSLALMALLLALAANVGVSTMVSSFRLTFLGYLDQRLASELYVRADSAAEAEALAAYLTPRVDAVLPIWSVKMKVAGRDGEVFGLTDHATYRKSWPVLSGFGDAWDRLAAGQGALINEQLSYRADLKPGDEVTLGDGWSMPVVGVYSDYGNPEGQVLVSDVALAARFPNEPRLRFALRLPPEKVEALKRVLLDDFGLPAENMIDQAGLKATSVAVFERTFAVTGALNILTLAIAAFALMTSLLTLADMRLPQLAPVWALGLTRRRLAGLEMLRTVCLAIFTMALALPVGLILAWLLLNVVNVIAFGWRLPMYVFPVDWLRLGALALVAAVAAAAIPVRRLARMPAARLLAVFAHER